MMRVVWMTLGLILTSCVGTAPQTAVRPEGSDSVLNIKKTPPPRVGPGAVVLPSRRPDVAATSRPTGPIVRGPWGIVPSALGPDDPDSVIQAEQGLSLAIRDAQGVWTQKSPLMRPRAGLCAGVIDSRLILVEGDHRPGIEVLDDRGAIPIWYLNDTYDAELQPAGASDSNTLHQGLYLAIGGVFENELWIAGGLRGQFNADGSSGRSSVYVYTLEGFGLSRSGEGPYILRQARRAACGGVVGDRFIVAGGVFQASSGAVKGVDVINLTEAGERAQSSGAAMPLAVAGAASAVTKEKLYVVGGYVPETAGGRAVQMVQVYDPGANQWLKSGDAGAPPELPIPLHSAAATVLNDVLYVLGGQSQTGDVLDSVYWLNLRDPKATWRLGVALTTARALCAAVTYKDSVWAIGGIGKQRSPLSSVEAFTP